MSHSKSPATRSWFAFTLAVTATSTLILLVLHQLPAPRLFGVPVDRAETSAAVDQLSHTFKDVAKAARGSVVSINSIKRYRPAAGERTVPRQQIPDELRRFFGDDSFERFFESPQGRAPFEQQGMGSGVIVSADGYVVTNNHVVQGADEVTVTLHDGTTQKANIVGTDKKTDLAVLKIAAQGLTAAPLGDADLMEVGDWVLAIGSPFNYHQTVTAGIISAKGRRVGVLQSVQGYEDFIQTDAAINPGNSGGPLLNLRGEVIGINTAIASRSGGFNGLGFAIPSKIVGSVYRAIVQHGHVERGQIGTLIQDLDRDLAQSFGYKSTDGVLVQDVIPGGPADRAGIQSGDIIIRYQGNAVNNSKQLRNAVAATAPGTRTSMTLFRDARERQLEIMIQSQDPQPRANRDEPSQSSTTTLGITVQTLTADQARQLGLTPPEQAVLVTQVAPGSLAARAGIRRGDLLLDVGGQSIDSAAEFRLALQNVDPAAGVRLQVKRGNARSFVFLKDLP
ncbi:MAG: DegQ family serine endoprotease [Planctomycetota bacterium]|nr:DegQ family serine endoprotease [Planctomycetota bacterium]